MARRSVVDEIYKRYKRQIDTVINTSGGNYLKAARVIAWFYGGSSETWRKFIAKTKISKPIPEEVSEFLEKMGGQKQKKK